MRSKSGKSSERNGVFPLSLAAVLAIVLCLSLFYLWQTVQSERAGSRIKQLEIVHAEVAARRAEEEYKWEREGNEFITNNVRQTHTQQFRTSKEPKETDTVLASYATILYHLNSIEELLSPFSFWNSICGYFLGCLSSLTATLFCSRLRTYLRNRNARIH